MADEHVRRGSQRGSGFGRGRSRRGPWEPLPGWSPQPTPVRDALDTLAATMGLASVDGINRLFLNWAEIVGEDLARRCTPKRLHDGELVVEAVDREWAVELAWMTGLIADRANAALGEGAVESVRVAGPSAS